MKEGNAGRKVAKMMKEGRKEGDEDRKAMKGGRW
jgi:hypothetical protein